MLILLAHHSKRGTGPNWESVAQLMGEGFTPSAISQQYTKKMIKREIFVEAQRFFGTGGQERGSVHGQGSNDHGSPGKKRKIAEVGGAMKQEGEQ